MHAALLAAGAGVRFGGDKLSALIDGETMLVRSARALLSAGCVSNALIVAQDACATLGALQSRFERCVNDRAAEGLGASVACAAEWARARGATALLLALADMPFVPPSHYAALLARRLSSPAPIVFTQCGARRLPPAIFSTECFGALLSLRGDVGARAMLADADLTGAVEADAALLVDIDSQADLARARSSN